MAPLKVVVFGVTGNQGRSVARALLEDGREFEVVGITRNPSSKGSQAVAEMGVKLVKGDLDDPSSYEPALAGADGMFLNANYWAQYNGSNAPEAKAAEIRQSTDAVDAAMRQGVKHIVYSSLESYQPRQELPHFDSKAEVTKYMKKVGAPATNLYTSYYYTNLLSSKLEDKDGVTIIKLPMPDDTILPSYNPDQIGLWARVAFENSERWLGKDITACGDNISVAGIAKTLSEISGKRFDTMHATKDSFMALEGQMDRELWLNYLAFVNNEMKRDPEASRKLVPEAEDFKAWAQSTPAVAEHFGFK